MGSEDNTVVVMCVWVHLYVRVCVLHSWTITVSYKDRGTDMSLVHTMFCTEPDGDILSGTVALCKCKCIDLTRTVCPERPDFKWSTLSLKGKNLHWVTSNSSREILCREFV